MKRNKKQDPNLNYGSMHPDTKRALARFIQVTGLHPTRFISNRHAMEHLFSVWVRKDAPGVAGAIDDRMEDDENIADENFLNGVRYTYLIDDFDDGTVRFDIDRTELL